MAKTEEVKEQSEFPLTLEEFLAELPRGAVESSAGFRHTMQQNGVADRKLRPEWQKLLDLYMRKPVRVTWSEWVKEKADTAAAEGGQ